MKNLILSVMIASISFSAMATDEGLFDLSLRVEGKADMFQFLSGWQCSSIGTTKYQEKLLNHKGEEKLYDRKSELSFSFSIFDKHSIKSEFRKDMNVVSKIENSITETCTKKEEVTRRKRVCDSTGIFCENKDVTETETKSLYFSWDCSFNEFPTQVDQKISSKCVPGKKYFGNVPSEDMLVAMFKKKIVYADLKLKKRYESFAIDLCKGKNLSKRRIIKFTQGLDGLYLEDDFIIGVSISGIKQKLEIKKDNGVYNDEIALCTEGDLAVTLSPREEDPIYDDIYYAAKNSSATVVLSTKNNQYKNASIDFVRLSKWDKVFLDKKQQIKLEIRNAPIN